MKKLLLLCAFLLPLLSKAQNLKEYTAANGITYHLNDTVKLGEGSGKKGSFQYIQDRGLPSDSHNLKKKKTSVTIKYIKKLKKDGVEKYFFIVDAGTDYRYLMYIDEAILYCEVTPCSQQSTTPADSAKAGN